MYGNCRRPRHRSIFIVRPLVNMIYVRIWDHWKSGQHDVFTTAFSLHQMGAQADMPFLTGAAYSNQVQLDSAGLNITLWKALFSSCRGAARNTRPQGRSVGKIDPLISSQQEVLHFFRRWLTSFVESG